MTHPFDSLTPDVILDALESVGLRGDGCMVALSSYENRVYQVRLEDRSDVVAKFYRPQRWNTAQIVEEHAFAAELMAADIPVVGPLTLHGSTLHHHAGFAFSISPRRGGRPPELDDEAVLEWIGRLLARLHTVGSQQPFLHRPALNLHSFGTQPMQWLLQHPIIPLDVQTLWADTCVQTLQAIATMAPQLDSVHNPTQANATALLRVHGDCHPGNILWTPADAPANLGPGPHFVDLDDACMGFAVQDLWMLLSGDRAQRTRQLSILLEGYETFRTFNPQELKLIEPLRTLRIIHYSAWLARRWDDPAFPLHFPWFGSRDYWLGQVHTLQEQLEAMQEPPLCP
jgi:Ser/Thr protein kinase RdoA (MazF antagonist)